MRPDLDLPDTRVPPRRPHPGFVALAAARARALMPAIVLAAAAFPAAVSAAMAAVEPSGSVAAATVRLPDTLEQRLLACTGCHGDQGRATPDGYSPRIAGKPAGYLYNQLAHFRDGRRSAASMTWMVSRLPDVYLREIAAHFAGLHPPYPPPPPPAASQTVLERGRRLVVEGDEARGLPACAACHGQALLGVEPAIPGLLGLPRDYLNAQLGAWRTGARRAHAPDCMATIAQRLALEEVSAVSAWLAAQPVPAPARAAPPAARALPLECGGPGR